MKRRAIIFTVVMMLAATVAFAQSGRGGGQRGWCHEPGMNHGMGGPGWDNDFVRPGMILRMADEIGLDANQKAQIEKMTQDNGLKRIDMKAQLEKAQLQLRHAQMNDAAETQVLQLMDDVGRIKTEMRKSAYTFHKSVKSLLTDDQLTKLKDLRKEWRGNHGDCPYGGPGKGHGYGPGDGSGNCPRGMSGKGSGKAPGSGNRGGNGQ
jgi:hypothetical protein